MDYLVGVARSAPKTCCTLLGKLSPAELKVEGADDGIPLVVIWSYVGMTDPQLAAADQAKASEVGEARLHLATRPITRTASQRPRGRV